MGGAKLRDRALARRERRRPLRTHRMSAEKVDTFEAARLD